MGMVLLDALRLDEQSADFTMSLFQAVSWHDHSKASACCRRNILFPPVRREAMIVIVGLANPAGREDPSSPPRKRCIVADRFS